MNGLAWSLLALTAIAAGVDWLAVARRIKPVEYLAKPLTLMGLVAVAIALDPVDDAMRAAFVIALALSLAGDIFLMLPRDLFVAGLASFLCAHIAYLVGFVIGPRTDSRLAFAALITVVVAVPLGVRLARAVRASRPALVGPVIAYMVVVSSMVATATGWGNAWAVAGAWLFFTSDALIGERRFVRPFGWGPLAVIVTYHIGQALLVVSLAY